MCVRTCVYVCVCVCVYDILVMVNDSLEPNIVCMYVHNVFTFMSLWAAQGGSFAPHYVHTVNLNCNTVSKFCCMYEHTLLVN